MVVTETKLSLKTHRLKCLCHTNKVNVHVFVFHGYRCCLFLLDFETVPTMWCMFLYFILLCMTVILLFYYSHFSNMLKCEKIDSLALIMTRRKCSEKNYQVKKGGGWGNGTSLLKGDLITIRKKGDNRLVGNPTPRSSSSTTSFHKIPHWLLLNVFVHVIAAWYCPSSGHSFIPNSFLPRIFMLWKIVQAVGKIRDNVYWMLM